MRNVFYTKSDIAEYIINLMKVYDTGRTMWIDPCSGKGAFLNLMPDDRRVGIDIVKRPNSIKMDFMNYECKYDDVIIASNPPFGKRGSIAKMFIEKSMTMSKYIAFIVPKGCVTKSYLTYIKSRGFNAYVESLPMDIFTTPTGIDFDMQTYLLILTPNYFSEKKSFE